MKTPKTILRFQIVACAISLFASSRGVAGEFTNLTFDEPNLLNLARSPLTGALIGPVSELLRGWTVELRPAVGAAYETYQEPVAFGYESTQPYHISLGEGPATDRYGLWFYFPASEVFREYEVIRVSQIGLVPPWAEELEVTTSGLRAFINGEYIPYEAIATGRFTMDVREYAGQEVELRFVTPPPGGGMDRHDQFDIIGFHPIPEPQTWVLLAVGSSALGFLVRRRRQKRR